jgi:hypothetical protein
LFVIERHKAGQHGHAHRRSHKLCQLAGLVADWLERRTREDEARLYEYAEYAPAYLWNLDA